MLVGYMRVSTDGARQSLDLQRRSSPGGYFHGMVAKAKGGELNLARTIWGLRARERRTEERRPPRGAH
jgi:hypothetical protein